ncbi:thioesterase II family protein [Xaviernesmea oryzae]|uniref:thioesterase II family protein n=1 Tax=Xaviernesmea oryzae TaxID=464029 RepID=UPI0008B124AF|nr:alpha/beta fold hydrolase [Xaviernesmea oryzae]SEM01958.1 Surfactin synthase thioesterase subunit [Xaviernesmea oryzae]
MSTCNPRIAYAFPHAGGTATIYRRWIDQLGHDGPVTLFPMELPGRGSLIRQEPIHDLNRLVENLGRKIIDDLNIRRRYGVEDWIIFGHSFGGVLGYATAQFLSTRCGLTPKFVVLSASIAPNIQDYDGRHLESDQDIIARLRRDNATAPALLDHPAMCSRLVTQIRSDYLIRNQYKKLLGTTLNCPIKYIRALDDPHVPADCANAWRAFTTKSLEEITISGDHFAIYENLACVLDVMCGGATRARGRHLVGA